MDTPRREIVLPRAAYMLGAILLGAYLVYWLRGVLTPLFLAFSLAYVLDPLVDRLEAWRVPRPAGIALVLVGVLGAVALFLGLVVPGIAADVAGVIRELPTQLAALWARLMPWLEQRGIEVPHSTTEWVERLNALASEAASTILAPAGNALGSLLGGTLSVLGSVAAALVVLVLGVYDLLSVPVITRRAVWGTRGERLLLTIGSIGYRDRSPSVAAQEPGQADKP